MNRYSKFADKICHINWHEEEDKEKTIEALEDIIRAEDRNYLETLDYIPLACRKELHQNHHTRRYFIERLIDLIKELPVVEESSETSSSEDNNSTSDNHFLGESGLGK